jgi:hypothetical protein
VAKFYDKYGIEVADRYASNKTAGIISRQTAIGYGKIYEKIKGVIDENFNPVFFEMMRCDYKLSCVGLYLFDIVGADKSFEEFEKIIPDYLFGKSHGRFDWLNPVEMGAKAWRFNESDPWEYDFSKMPPLKVYDADACTYNDEECSMKEYVQKRWGDQYVRAIEAVNNA